MAALDINNLVAETNKHLRHNQQIHPDDPLVASVILHDQILRAQVDTLNKVFDERLEEKLDRLTVISEQQVQRAETISEKLIANCGNKLENQVFAAVQRSEERLRQAEAKSEASRLRSSWLAWTGGGLIMLHACAMVGTWLGNYFFDVSHRRKCGAAVQPDHNIRCSSRIKLSPAGLVHGPLALKPQVKQSHKGCGNEHN